MKINGTSNKPYQSQVLLDTFVEQISALQNDVSILQNNIRALDTRVGQQLSEEEFTHWQENASVAGFDADNITAKTAAIETITSKNIRVPLISDPEHPEIRNKFSADVAEIQDLTAIQANIPTLITDDVTVQGDITSDGDITAKKADLDELEADLAKVNGTLEAELVQADVEAKDVKAETVEISEKLEVEDIEVKGSVTGVSDITADSITANEAKATLVNTENIRDWVSQVMNREKALLPTPQLEPHDRYTIKLPKFTGTYLLSWENGSHIIWSATVIGNGMSYSIAWGSTTDVNHITDFFQYAGNLYIRISSNGRLKYAYSSTEELDEPMVYFNMDGWTSDKSLEELCNDRTHYINGYPSGTLNFGTVIIPRLEIGEGSKTLLNFRGSCSLAELPSFADTDVGDVWNITTYGYTDTRFLEGSGLPINIGDDIVCIMIEHDDEREIKWNKFAAGVNYENFVAEKITATDYIKTDEIRPNEDTKTSFNADVAITGDLTVDNVTASGNLSVSGNSNLADTIITGDITVSGDLSVAGDTILHDTTITGDLVENLTSKTVTNSGATTETFTGAKTTTLTAGETITGNTNQIGRIKVQNAAGTVYNELQNNQQIITDGNKTVITEIGIVPETRYSAVNNTAIINNSGVSLANTSTGDSADITADSIEIKNSSDTIGAKYDIAHKTLTVKDADGQVVIGPAGKITAVELDAETVKTTGDIDVSGEGIFRDDVSISGDLYVNGTMHINDTETAQTSDDYLVLRHNKSTALGTNEYSGIAVHNYTLNKTATMTVDGQGTWRVADNVETDTNYTNVSYYNGTYYTGLSRTAASVVNGIKTAFNEDELDEVAYESGTAKYYHFDGVHWFEVSIENDYMVISDQYVSDASLLSTLAGLNRYDLIYFRTLTMTEISEVENEPVLTRAEETDLQNNDILVWDATAKKAVRAPRPQMNNTYLKATLSGGAVSYNWSSGGGVGIAFIGTRAQYNTARLIPAGADGHIPAGSKVIITDEDAYITGDLR